MRESLAPQLRPPALTAAITLIVHEAGLHAALGDSSGNVRIAAQVLAFIEPILAISVSPTALSVSGPAFFVPVIALPTVIAVVLRPLPPYP
jgi:hypothetical protein